MSDYNFVTEWVINTIKEKYADDIALVISHGTLRINTEEKAMSYFVPITKRGAEFAQTFILSGVGYDIWGIPWERLEGFARLEEYNITCLADAEVLYARTAEDKERFEALKKKQASYLADKEKMRACAIEAYEQAKNIYLEMLFAKGSDVKLGAGYVLDYLARAIAFSNNSYFKRSQTDQLNELKNMENVPEGFDRLYTKVIYEKDEASQKKLCYELICMVRDYLSKNGQGKEAKNPCEKNYQDLADWYGELSYTWLRIRYYAEAKDAVRVYMWGIFLQSELNQVCEDFGIEKIELMKYYDAANLSTFAEYSNEVEKLMRYEIVKGGGKIWEYADQKEFLNEI